VAEHLRDIAGALHPHVLLQEAVRIRKEAAVDEHFAIGQEPDQVSAFVEPVVQIAVARAGRRERGIGKRPPSQMIDRVRVGVRDDCQESGCRRRRDREVDGGAFLAPG
jgi:hypothetical protein